MKSFFRPQGCAVVGASRDPAKPGHQILRSMLDAGFPADRLHPVNPRETEIAGLRAYPDLVSVPGTVEMAVLMVPERALDAVLADVRARARTRGDLRALVVASGGYAETGTEEGRSRQERLVRTAREAGVRVIGPNCIGVIDTRSGVDTTFLHGVVHRPGCIAFVSQSGAVGAWFTQMLSSEPEPVGFSKLVSLGNMADVSMGEVLDYLRDDPETAVVGVYLEGVPRPRALLRSLAALSEEKPVVVLKTGRSEAGGQAATSHTGALAGPDRVWDGALRQAGALRVETMEDFVDVLRVLADRTGRRPDGSARPDLPRPPLRVFVVTHAGGPGVYAMDALARHGGLLVPARVSAETRRRLADVVPPYSSVCRPEGHVDMTASATPEQHAAVVSLVLEDPGVDALVTLDLPTRFLTDTAVAEALAGAWSGSAPGKVFLPVIMHGRWSAAGRAVLQRAGLTALAGPDRAAAVLAALARLAALDQGVRAGQGEDGVEARVGDGRTDAFPEPPAPERPPAPQAEGPPGEGPSGRAGRTLSEAESAALLRTAGVTFAPFRVAASADEVLRAAEEVGYPVVLKLCSAFIPHKAAAGVVRLDLRGPEDLARAVAEVAARAEELLGPERRPEGFLVQRQVPPGLEVIVGGLWDPLFGPVVATGAGGTRVGLDSPLLFRLAPLTGEEAAGLAREVLAELGVEEDRADLEALAGVIRGMASLLASRPDIVEADLNPVVLHRPGEGAVAVDALVRLSGGG